MEESFFYKQIMPWQEPDIEHRTFIFEMQCTNHCAPKKIVCIDAIILQKRNILVFFFFGGGGGCGH